METRLYKYPASKGNVHRAHVGVVGSGDLEILLEPSNEPYAQIELRTGIDGFEATWKKVLDRFFSTHDIAATIKINDFGATPGVVLLRLEQVLEVSRRYENA
ncbi:malonate decarboxylase subunit delta [Halalkalibacter krulwichiae]|uniref:Malonate decarboxylase acyl carrier protein n=1 Tax=Halalkalibacter krulwichiae TaxID=199441 RepID=A0A1X9MH86_9BACI|nr:malonate decarboxylase subunit delta [Halalkalibacter krulwichiae]ARK29802.1 Malonate decarboxylase acyl carrier protein [Halalkalibacter krulwichiae]